MQLGVLFKVTFEFHFMKNIQTYLNTPFLRHLLFWVVVLLYFVLAQSNISFYADYGHLLESYGVIVIAQMITAYTIIYVLVPRFLDQKKIGLFIFWTVTLLIAVYGIYQMVKMYYFDTVYFDFYNEGQRRYALEPLWKRFTYLSVFLSKCILYLTPTALLLMYRFYKNQQKFLKLNEQKKVAELSALKNQLNPHFLFNTLNNLYTLALEKSDKTPEVIEHLSGILDYILYRCNTNYVSIHKEIELIENYLLLEKIRYGKRIVVNFEHHMERDVKIAPLILLTFIENAFKHGVSQELNTAKINISISLDGADIVFRINNTKPAAAAERKDNVKALGNENVKKQLELLYTNTHDLEIVETNDSYEVVLKLDSK